MRASFNKAISVLLPIYLPLWLGTRGVEEHKGPQTIGRAGAFLTPMAAGEWALSPAAASLRFGAVTASSPAPLFPLCLPGVRQAGERRARQGAGDMLRRVHINRFLQPVAGCLT